ncbi:MAG: hypothetical protein AAF337_14300 [Pseudomonadota bacterium]
MKRSAFLSSLPAFDVNQGAAASYGVIVGAGIAIALDALWQPSYTILPALSLCVLISTVWRIRSHWPDTLSAIRPFELGGALALMFIVNMVSLYGLIPLLLLVCIVPRGTPQTLKRT